MTTQVSAHISNDTKILFEDFSRRSGLKKGFIIEQALVRYINAQNELPADIVVPSSVTVSREVFNDTIITDKKPTEALRKLMNGV